MQAPTRLEAVSIIKPTLHSRLTWTPKRKTKTNEQILASVFAARPLSRGFLLMAPPHTTYMIATNIAKQQSL